MEEKDLVQVEENVEVENTEIESTEDGKKFSQEELDKIVQSRLDREFKKFQSRLEAEKSEAEKLAKMSEEEKAKAELDKMKKDFENERATFLKEKLQLETVKQLAEYNLPTKFADFIVRDTADETKANLNAFKTAWDSELQAQIEKHVDDRLKGTTPQKANGGHTGGMTYKEFGLLPPAEKLKIMNEQPDLYNQIIASK